jgi:hypothetical protein
MEMYDCWRMEFNKSRCPEGLQASVKAKILFHGTPPQYKAVLRTSRIGIWKRNDEK